MSHQFSTQYFALTQDAILLLRKRFPYRSINYADIKSVELTKGTDVKRPIASLIFGSILLLTSIYLMLNFFGFQLDDLTGGGKTIKTFGYFAFMVFFLFGFGVYSIYRALPFHSVINFTTILKETESFSIAEVIKNKEMDSLISSLKNSIGSERMKIDRDLMR